MSFFLKTLQKQKIRLGGKLDLVASDNFAEKLYFSGDLTELEEKIFTYFDKETSGTTAKMVEYTNANRNTVKKHCRL